MTEAIAAWLDRNAWALDYPLRSTLTEAAEQIRAGAWRTTKGDASK